MMKLVKLKQMYQNMILNNVMTDLLEHDVPWVELIQDGYIVASSLDSAYYIRSSDKPVARIMLELSASTYDDVNTLDTEARESIANILFALFGDKWKRLYDAFTAEYNPISNYDMTETETISDDTDTENRQIGTISDSGTNAYTNELDISDSDSVITDNDTTLAMTDTGTRNIHTDNLKLDTGTVTDSKSETTHHEIYGFNSSTGQDSDETTVTGSNTQTNNLSSDTDITELETRNLAHSETGTNDTTTTGTHTGNEDTTYSGTTTNTRTNNLTNTDNVERSIDRTLQRSGNIGVTTSQQMLESEIQLRQWNYFTQVFEDIDSILCLDVY